MNMRYAGWRLSPEKVVTKSFRFSGRKPRKNNPAGHDAGKLGEGSDAIPP
jgi:hypothetical protein